MKNVSLRTWLARLLTCVLLFGLLVFVLRYALFADRWVSFQGSPHVYVNGTLDTGVIVDRSGVQLYSTEGGKTYAWDALTRKATLHLLGDRAGNIPAMVLRAYTSKLVGYDKLNGTAATEGGGKLTLTVSAQVQAIALQALNGRRGTVGVYNYKTGEILCAVSSPAFDPDDPPDLSADTSGKWDGVYVYRFFNTTYTPGSIFKLVTLATAIETDPAILDRTFTCTGETYVNGERITCPKAHGTLDLRDALAKSCNCSFAEITLSVGKENLERKVRQLGIEDSLAVDGFQTAQGHFDLSNASDNDLAWAGIGQYTDLVNPCQYLTWMGAIAAGGAPAVPYLVSEARCGGSVKYEADTAYLSSKITPQAAETLRGFMRYNVTEMYGAWNFPNLEVCAKSGTAEVGGDANTATFAGFIDDERYPLAFIVIVEEGGAGSTTCAPIAGTVLAACVNVMDGE